MNAQEARKLANENLRGPVIETFICSIKSAIERTALSGKFFLVDPLSYCKPSRPNMVEEEAIIQLLRSDGYIIKHHPDPDPGHPCSRSYTTIEW